MSDPNENGPRVQPRPVVFSQKNQPSNAGKSTPLRVDQQGGEAVSDNITLPREVARLALSYIEWYIENEDGGRFVQVREAEAILRTALAAEQPVPTVKESLTHPGYVIGNHWFETAYERLCAGEAEDAILEDYEVVREPRLRDLRRDAERYRWLRERAWFQDEFEGRYGDSGETVHELDAAIDAAMEASTAPASAAGDSSTAPEAKP